MASAWPELEVAGLLWDGSRLVGIAKASTAQVKRVTAGRPLPIALELGGLRQLGQATQAGVAIVALGDGPGDTEVGSAPPAPPSPTFPAPGAPPSWVSVVGRVTNDDRRQLIEVAGARIVIQRLCERGGRLPEGIAGLVGVAIADPPRILVGCDGVRAAPALALAASEASGTVRSPKALAASFDRNLAATPSNRLVAAMLLAVGVAILVLAVIVGRRFDPTEPDDAATEEADPEESAQPEPRLALVRLPNEHGP